MDRKPRVFVTQITHRRDHQTKAFVPTINIAPAAEHGEIIVMMPPQAPFHATADLVKQLREHLKDYDYEAGDSIVATGDPQITAVACALLGRMYGVFWLLKWDRQIGRYLRSLIRV